jgi:ABC-2 type transport system permease protein
MFENLNKVYHIAYTDLKGRYRRSTLGPLWQTATTLCASLVLGAIWSNLMNIKPESFVPALTAGLIAWQCISSAITESTSAFARYSGAIKNIPLDLSIYPLLVVAKQIINLVHTLPVYLIVMMLFDVQLNEHTLFLPLSLVLFIVMLSGLIFIFAILGTRFRDFEFLINAGLPLIMFMSPVFYTPSQLSISKAFVWLNPFTYLIEILRLPLMGEPISSRIWIVCLLMTFILLSIACIAMRKYRKSIVYWI